MELPANYRNLTPDERRSVRQTYARMQKHMCWHCGTPLKEYPAQKIQDKKVDWSLFPYGFLNNPVHLQHNHKTGLTEGAVHALCNAVLWQFHGK